MRFLVDENCDAMIVTNLRNEGYDVEFVTEVSSGDIDDDVLTRSVQEERVLITEDLDFCEMVFRDQKPAYAIILLRIKPRSLKTTRIFELIRLYGEEIIGHLITVTVDNFRLRQLL